MAGRRGDGGGSETAALWNLPHRPRRAPAGRRKAGVKTSRRRGPQAGPV